MPTELPRVTTSLTPAEWDALELHAAARGQRPSEAAREAIRAMLRDPALVEPSAVVADVPGLAAAAAALDRTAATLAKLLPSAETSRETERATRETLRQIAEGVGVIAGAVAPVELVEDAFGLGVRTLEPRAPG